MNGSTALASRNVVVSAPMSFAGSAQRIWRITWNRAGWAAAGMVTVALLAIFIAWTAVLTWYMMFGFWLVPYRLIRRSQRKDRLAQLRHAELMGRRA